jgi:membrane glycosyltransferase
VLATWQLARTFPYPQLSWLETAILATFSILFAWISFSFWTGMAGFLHLLRNKNIKSVAGQNYSPAQLTRPPRSRTAVLVPICNEEVERVFAGVEATYRSLEATGKIDKFDFYLLSDSSDPEKQIEEEVAWARMCQRIGGFGKLFYRHRRVNIKRKSGNVADFVRRWGANYEYMVVFDADSVMEGDTLVLLANMMDLHPGVGILQTTPTIVNRESLFARVQQFASRAYGPVFAAGLRFWQGGESYYWGHNAIIRIAPFAKYCGLARLPGRPPLGGEILSHDFVEAALMGRAGWEVWIVDLPGSFEESPPTILDELKRDRRWCQGNLQHLRLLCADGFRFGHRAIMAMGIMAYASAFFWAVFLILSTAELVVEALVPPVYFSNEPTLFPVWPQWHPEIALTLLGTTAVMLFLAKCLSFFLIVIRREAQEYGGFLRLACSVVLEILLSMMLAPIRMWFHSKYVWLTLLGREIKWGAQRRDGVETSWSEALRQHGVLTLVGIGWTVGLFQLNPLLAGWLLPVTVPMSLSIPISVFTSKVRLGAVLRRWGLLLIPEESAPPEVIRDLRRLYNRACAVVENRGLLRVTDDAAANAVRVAFLRGKIPRSEDSKERNARLREKVATDGPAKLTKEEMAHLLFDAQAVAALYKRSCQNGPDDSTMALTS